MRCPHCCRAIAGVVAGSGVVDRGPGHVSEILTMSHDVLISDLNLRPLLRELRGAAPPEKDGQSQNHSVQHGNKVQCVAHRLQGGLAQPIRLSEHPTRRNSWEETMQAPYGIGSMKAPCGIGSTRGCTRYPERLRFLAWRLVGLVLLGALSALVTACDRRASDGSGSSSGLAASRSIESTTLAIGACKIIRKCPLNQQWDSRLCRCISDGLVDGGSCVVLQPCTINDHWDSRLCKCISDGLVDGGSCVVIHTCPKSEHWDPQLCKCAH